MLDPITIAGSALAAAQSLIDSAASDEEAEFTDLPGGDGGGGVALAQIVVAPLEYHGGASNIDSVAQAINFRKAQNLYTANAEVIVAAQQMFGSLINILDTEQDVPPQDGADNTL